MIKEKNPNYKGLWAKYKKYEILKINNEYYIRPDKKLLMKSMMSLIKKKNFL